MKPDRVLSPIVAVLSVVFAANVAAALDRLAPLAPRIIAPPEVRISALADPGLYPHYSREDPVFAYPLHAAALNDDAPLALRLIQRGTPVDVRDRNGRTPLMVAAAFGNLAVAEVLLANRADPGARDRLYGDTALHFAALSGNTGVASALLSRGVQTSMPGPTWARHRSTTPRSTIIAR